MGLCFCAVVRSIMGISKNGVADLLTRLDISGRVGVTENGQITNDRMTHLDDGDELQCFRPIGGG